MATKASDATTATAAAAKPASPRRTAAAGKPAARKPVARKPAAPAMKMPPPLAATPPAAPAKAKKVKMVRDSFIMPKDDHDRIAAIKARCLKQGLEFKKSEVIRAGLIALGKLGDAELVGAFVEVERIKTGRPKKK